MKKEQINDLFERFENARYLLGGVECWSARELQNIFNYVQWRNFTKVVDKAREACENAGIPVSDHFADISKMVDLGSKSQRQVDDIALTRYACYLVAQNGDPAKSEVAFALESKEKFVVKTKKKEIKLRKRFYLLRG